jgi:4-amino-4-deoxy-L-arabinose transferase-like glycosyltransferase
MMLLAGAAIAASGAGLVATTFPERPGDAADRAVRLCFGVALGLGTWSAAYACSRMLGVSSTAKDWALVALGLCLFVGGSWRRSAALPSPHAPAPRWLWLLLGAACAVATAAFFEHNRRFPDGGWDAWMIWNMRARFLERTCDLRAAFSPALSFRAHADYPWLLPGAVAQAVLLAGRERIVSEVVAAAFGTLAVAIVPLALARVHGARWGLLGALAIVSVPSFAIFTSNQQSDVPLAVFLSSAAALIALAYTRPERPLRMLVLAGFAAGLGAWTKNEGILYALCLGGGLLWRARDLRAALAFAAGALPAAILLLAFKLTLAPPNDLAHFSTPALVLAHAVDVLRWGDLLARLLRRIVFFQSFGLWLVAEAVLVGLVIRGLPRTPVGASLLLASAGLILLYVLQPHSLDWLVRTSVDRLVIQLWPTSVLVTFQALARTIART